LDKQVLVLVLVLDKQVLNPSLEFTQFSLSDAIAKIPQGSLYSENKKHVEK